MEPKTKTQITAIFFIVVSVAFSFMFWLSIEDAIQASAIGIWAQPLVFFSLLSISWSTGIILAKDNGWLRIISLLVLVSGIHFVFNWKHLLVVVLSGLIAWLAIIYIKRETDSRLYINAWYSLRIGKKFFIVAIALIITSHYYFNHPSFNSGELSEMKFGKQQAWLVTKIMSAIDPDLSIDEIENLTIDEFIMRKTDVNSQAQSLKFEEQLNEAQGDIPNGIWDGLTGGINVDEVEKEIILRENRDGIGEMIGKEVRGDDKMVDVVSGLMTNRLNEMFAPKNDYRGTTGPAVTWILTLALFVSLLSLGLFIGPFLVLVVWVLVKVLIWTKLVTIEKKDAMQEVII